MKEKIAIQNQGTIKAEFDGIGFVVCFPDGEIKHALSMKEVEKMGRAWFKLNVSPSVLGIGKIEYSNLNK